MLQDDRDRAQRFGEPAWSCGLLADASELERQSLIDEPGGLATHAQLDDDEMGSIERAIAIGGEDQLAGPFVAREDATREAAHDLEPLRVDVQQHELVDRHALAAREKALDELRGVRAAATDNSDFYPHVGASYAKMGRNG